MNQKTKLHGYKYTMYDRLRKMSVQDYEIAMQWLPEQIGVTKDTFRNWLYTKADAHLEIPSTAILKMAVFFECAPIEMFAYPFCPETLLENWTTKKDQTHKANQMKLNFYETI